MTQSWAMCHSICKIWYLKLPVTGGNTLGTKPHAEEDFQFKNVLSWTLNLTPCHEFEVPHLLSDRHNGMVSYVYKFKSLSACVSRIIIMETCHFLFNHEAWAGFNHGLHGMGLLPDTQNCGCACAGNAGNVFPVTAGKRSRHASRHVRHARAVMHAGIAN